jgi:succinate dehydrogenase/fumarate reductase flavoprotein subunit
MNTWDREVDVVVVGCGAGGMAAALSAHAGGCQVLMLEKTDRVGGSTAISGGAVWAPLNHQTEQAGHPDDMDKVLTYLQHTVGDAAPIEMRQAFLNHCADAVEWFERHTEVRLAARTFSPDYYPDRPGAAMGGRSLDPLPFDGRLLGENFKLLRDPLPEFMVLGGMMVNMTDAKHLLAVTRSLKSWWEGMKLVWRYGTDRLRCYHRGTRLVLGNALAARLFKSVLDQGIEFKLGVSVRECVNEQGRIVGLVVESQGQIQRIRTRRGVVLATGGFPWHAGLRDQNYPKPTGPWSMSPVDNAGDGMTLGQRCGGILGSGHFSPAFWAPISILNKPDGTQLRYPHLVWDRAKPGLMAVNSAGRRFVNESTSYHEFVLGMYRSNQQVPSVPSHLICDATFMERWGLGLALPGGRPREHLVQAGYLIKAPSLDAMAAQLGIDAQVLNASVDRFNQAADAGQDPEFGKGSTAYNRYLGDADHGPNPCLGHLRQAPYYAVKVYAGDIGTALGLRCNEHAQVLDAQNQAIEGLYAAGNDMHSVMGGQYPAPGITLGPALTFGWVAGNHLAQIKS